MSSSNGVSRREFFRGVGAAAGAAGLGSVTADTASAAAMAQDAAAAAPSPLPEPSSMPYPVLSRRTLGWLRLLWEKATTQDDWSSNGIPHPWWDRYSLPVVLSCGRFDLSFSAYGI